MAQAISANCKSLLSGSRSSSIPSLKLLIKCGILINLIVSSILMSSSFMNSSNLIEAKQTPSSSASLLTKKPPFNGSIFGKRSGAPSLQLEPTRAPPVLAGFDYSSSDSSNGGRDAAAAAAVVSAAVDRSTNYLLALYLQQLRQQEKERASAIAQAAFNRCLVELELSATYPLNIPSACDELPSLVANRRNLMNQ